MLSKTTPSPSEMRVTVINIRNLLLIKYVCFAKMGEKRKIKVFRGRHRRPREEVAQQQPGVLARIGS